MQPDISLPCSQGPLQLHRTFYFCKNQFPSYYPITPTYQTAAETLRNILLHVSLPKLGTISLPNPKLQGQILQVVRHCLFNLFIRR